MNIQSLSILHTSHPELLHVNYDSAREVTFAFKDIFLQDSFSNEKASHGYISYSLDLIKNLPIETKVKNTAYIHFDDNPAIAQIQQKT